MKAVSFLLIVSYVPLMYANGYFGAELQTAEVHAEDMSHRSADAVSSATRKYDAPTLMIA